MSGEPPRRGLSINANLVRNLRRRCGWSQDDLGHAAQLSDRAIRNIEAGRRVDLNTVMAVIAALNRTLGTSFQLRDFVDDPISDDSVPRTLYLLEAFVNLCFDADSGISPEAILSADIVFHCELGTLLGIEDVRRRNLALRISTGDQDVSIVSRNIRNEYAVAKWQRGVKTSLTETLDAGQSGLITIRVSKGQIAEVWSYPTSASNVVRATFLSEASDRSLVTLEGHLLRASRLVAGLTQSQLAKTANLSIRLVRKAEHGDPIQYQSLRSLANALSVDPGALILSDSDQKLPESSRVARVVEFLEQIWNHSNFDVIQTHLHPTFRFHHEAGLVSSRDEMRQRIETLKQSFDAFDFRVLQAQDFGSFVVCRWTVSATHVGTWADLPTTGKRVCVEGATWIHVVNKKFGDGWDFWDPKLLYLQLLGERQSV